ncbi:hypothetical protein GGI05_005242 [Coemansia sp. RSA 2603]|nr:hypothetical protein GGI05_005242 [Coemansia sp. RSA 2603]
MMIIHPTVLIFTVLLTGSTFALPVPETEIVQLTVTSDAVYNINILEVSAFNTLYPTMHGEHVIIDELYERGGYYMNGY